MDEENMREMNIMGANGKQFVSESSKEWHKRKKQKLPKIAVSQEDMPIASEQEGYYQTY